MATYYRYKRPITNSGAITTETREFTQSDATSEVRDAVFGDTGEAILAFETPSGDIHDYSEFVSELQIQHNDVDGEDAGRCKHSGKMKRDYITNKHTLNVKMINRLPSSVARGVFIRIETTTEKLSFWAWYQTPCGTAPTRKNFYCSTINYGAQRYDRNEGKCFYDGMNFNLIEM